MTFQWTITTLLLSAVVLTIAAAVCFVSWSRSGYAKRYGLLEIIRFLIVTLAVVTLNQPEIPQPFVPDEKPTVAVLVDQSLSMNTKDVQTAAEAGTPDGGPVSRESIANRIEQPEQWSKLDGELEVVFEPFSSSLSQPERGTDLNQALEKALRTHSALRAVVLLSDGDWNLGASPDVAAAAFRMKQVPVYTVGIGSESRLPDIVLESADAPTFGVAGKSVRIPFRVANWLPRDQELLVTLSGEGMDPITKSIRLPAMGRLQDALEWKPETVGEYQLNVDVPVQSGEAITDNNRASFPITIRTETLKVLIIESYPRWEYRYLRNALERDPGVDVSCLLYHPDLNSVGGGRGYLEDFPAESELFDYDVVFLGDVGLGQRQLTEAQCEQLRQLVRSHAGGLVFLPGFRGRQLTLLDTELGELYPVVPDPARPGGVGSEQPARFALTDAGRRSLLTRLESADEDNERTWKNLPGFQWHAASLRARTGTEVLVTHESASSRFGRVPLIATRTSGTGKILYMGTDAAWRWRKGVEDLYHYRFWGQVVRWMAYQRNMSAGTSMRLFYSPDRPEAGNRLSLNVNVMSKTGEPLKEGHVTVKIEAPDGTISTVQLSSASEDSWGLFTGDFVPEEGGLYKLTTTCEETEESLQTEISVQGLERERIGEPARFDVLREVSEISRGRLVTPTDLEAVISEISQIPEPEIELRRVRIWSHPAWAGLLIALLTIFWIARKLTGLV